MDDNDIRNTLLLELHEFIAQAAVSAVAKLGGHQLFVPHPTATTAAVDDESRQIAITASVRAIQAALTTYPPASGSADPMTRAEHDALAGMDLSAVARSALTKLVADAAASVVFHFLCVVDGVGDPQVWPQEEWIGATIGAPRSGEYREMLHDTFFDTYVRYAEWKRARMT